MQKLSALYSSGAMNAAAPGGHPLGGSIPIQKVPCPPCLAKALRRESIVKSKIFMDWE
jgi:hypothetical protein